MRKSFQTFGVAFLLVNLVACKQIKETVAKATDAANNVATEVTTAPTAPTTQSPHAMASQPKATCEEHWLVNLIVQDLHSMAQLQGAGWSSPPVTQALGPQQYLIKGSGEYRLELEPSVWSPKTYRGLAEAFGIQAAASADSSQLDQLASQLLTPTIARLEEQNQRISLALQAQPKSAQLHQQAALLLGTFGLLENGRNFYDNRVTICRMTSHLVVAAQAQAASAKDNSLPSLVYDTLAGRNARVYKKVSKRFKAEGVPTWERYWLRILDVAVRQDWRVMRKSEGQLTLLGEFIHLKALRSHLNTEPVEEYLPRIKHLQNSPHLIRLLAVPATGQEIEHLTTSTPFSQEFKAIQTVAKTPLPTSPTREDVLPFLQSKSPRRLVDSSGQLAIIHQGDWAAHFCRHIFKIASAINYQYFFWPEGGKLLQWRLDNNPFLFQLPNAALNYRYLAIKDGRVKDLQQEALRIFEQTPEVATSKVIFGFQPRTHVLRRYYEGPAIPQGKWFRDPIPYGTGYLVEQRLEHVALREVRKKGIFKKASRQYIRDKGLYLQNPWSLAICASLAIEGYKEPEFVLQTYQALEGYSIARLAYLERAYKFQKDPKRDVIKRQMETFGLPTAALTRRKGIVPE